MDSFDAKWGNIPTSMSPNSKFTTICCIQFVVCICILLALQPPFVHGPDDEYSAPRTSFMNVVIVSIICVVMTASISLKR